MLSHEHQSRCIPQDQLYRLAGNVLDDSDVSAAEILEHAATCDSCARRLKQSLVVMGAGQDSLETEFVKRQGRATQAARSAISSGRRLWVYAVLFGTLSCAMVLLYILRDPAARALSDLSIAYAHQRSLDLRLPHSPFGAIILRRGTTTDSAEVLALAAQILRHKESGRQSARWQHAEGRLEIVRGNYSQAIKTLTAAMDLGDRSSDLYIDLAVAYFGQGEQSGRSSDYTDSLELLGLALNLKRDSREALFDRAIVEERLHQYDAAIRDWNTFLSRETDPGWITEAKLRRNKTQLKLQSMFRPNRGDQQLEERLEQILRKAADWESGSIRVEAFTVAKLLAADHEDTFLASLLRSKGQEFCNSVLSKMALLRRQIGGSGFYAKADIREQSVACASPAQVAWLSFETLYIASHTTGDQCLSIADRLLRECKRHQYKWLAAQTLLERSTCEIMANRLGAADVSTREALAITAANRFPIAHLRAAGFLSSHLVNAGRYREAYRVAIESIEEAELIDASTLRFHQFFDTIMRAAKLQSKHYTARAAAVMCSKIAMAIGAIQIELTNLAVAAQISAVLGETAEGYEYLRSAESLATKLDRRSTAQVVFAKVALAEASNNLTSLERVNEELTDINNPFWRVPFLISLARLQSARDPQAAVRTVDEALRWLTRPAASSGDHNRWRQQLEDASRLKLSLLLERGLHNEALDLWLTYLRNTSPSATHGQPQSLVQHPPNWMSVTLVRVDRSYDIWWQRNGITRFSVLGGSASDLEGLARELGRLCSDPLTPAKAIQSVSKTIENLFPTAFSRDLISASDLELRLDYPLREFPFHVLRFDNSDGLGLNHTIIYKQRQSESYPVAVSSSDKALLVAGDIVAERFRTVVRPLPTIDEEVHRLAANFTHARVLSGTKATLDEIESSLKGAAVFHFSGHGYSDASGPFLLIAPSPSHSDGLIKNIPSLEALKLVVLAACRSSEAEDTDPVSAMNLAGSFLSMGAKAVVAARWDIDSAATEDFLPVFYKHLLSGNSPWYANLQAARAIHKQNHHPFFWAAFSVYS